MDELGIYARGGEAKRLRRRSGDGEGVWTQKDEDVVIGETHVMKPPPT
jgi:hypothetical protein